MKTQNAKPPAVWVVVVRCNLDDVIAGAYFKKPQANRRMKDILTGVGMPEAGSAKDRMMTWDDSGLIAVAIYRVQGNKVEYWEQEAFDEPRKAA